MNNLDRIFLQDYLSFGYLNHPVAAAALYRSFLHSAEAATDTHAVVAAANPGHGAAEASHDGVRVRKICTARLFAEFVAAFEDFGALGSAVRHRRKGGVMCRYVRSSVGEAAQFFQEVRACPTDDAVLDLLRLPPLADLRDRLGPSQFAAVAGDYAQYPPALRTCADGYCDPYGNVPAPVGSFGGGIWRDLVTVVLDENPTGAAAPPEGWTDVYVRTYNRVKHRFAVVDRLDAFAALPEADRRFWLAHHSIDPEAVRHLVLQTAAVAVLGAELAMVLLELDGAGVRI